MTLALEEPVLVAKPPSEKPFWTGGRVRHHGGHYLCDLVGKYMPGSCMNDPFEDDRGIKHSARNRQEEAIVLKADFDNAWKSLNGLSRKVVRGVISIGPRERLESDDEWYDRQLIWWILHRTEFGNFPAEVLLSLSHDATNQMARDLNRPRKNA